MFAKGTVSRVECNHYTWTRHYRTLISSPLAMRFSRDESTRKYIKSTSFWSDASLGMSYSMPLSTVGRILTMYCINTVPACYRLSGLLVTLFRPYDWWRNSPQLRFLWSRIEGCISAVGIRLLFSSSFFTLPFLANAQVAKFTASGRAKVGIPNMVPPYSKAWFCRWTKF